MIGLSTSHWLGQPKDTALIKSKLILGMCLVYIIHFFIQSQFLDILLFVLTVLVFCAGVPHAKPVPRFFGVLMFAVGVLLMGMKGSLFAGTLNGFLANLPLLNLVLLVPLISIPLKMDGYFHSIHYYMEKLADRTRVTFAGITLFLFIFGPIMNLGSIRVLHDMIKDLKLKSSLLAKSYLVGFSTVMLWSPYFASVALVLFYLHVPVASYIPWGLLLALIQIVIGNLLFWPDKQADRQRKMDETHITDRAEEREHRKNIGKLVVVVAVLMGTIFLFEFLTKWPMMFLVSLTAVLYPAVWCVWRRKYKEIVHYIRDFEVQTVQTMNNEIVLFLSAGLFGKAMGGTAVAHGIQLFLNRISAVSFLLLIVTVMAIILVFTFAGIHQVVTVTALVTQMNPEIIGASPVALALLFMVSWSTASILSPVNPCNLLVSGFVEKPAIWVGVKQNGLYSLSLLTMGALLIYLIH